MNVQIETLPPSEVVVPRLVSSSQHIVGKRLQEFQPQSQVSYTYSSNNEIIFDINSASDFADFANGYLRFKLSCDLTNNSIDAVNKYLAEGGAHSLFRNITVEALSGSQLQRVERYNKLYSILSSATHSKSYVDNSLWRAGDGCDVEQTNYSSLMRNHFRDVTCDTFTFDATGGVTEQLLTGVGTLFLTEFAVGDEVFMADPAGEDNNLIGVVTSITSNTVMNLAHSTGNGDFDVAGTGSVLKVRKPVVSIDSNRKVYANTDNIVVCLQPEIPMLKMSEWMPLFLFRGGLRIRFELERPEFVLSNPFEPIGAGYAAANYTISSPVYMIPLIKPDSELRDQYVQMYKSSGLNYSYLSYRHFLNIAPSDTSGTYSMQINSNVRSAKFIVGRIQDLRAETITAGTVNSGKSTYTCDSIAQGLKGKLKELQFASGSERFPQSKPLDTSDISNSELFAEMERTFGNMGVVVSGKRFSPLDWQERVNPEKSYENTLKAESSRLILCSELSRDLHSPMAGLNLSLSPLQGEFNFDGVYQVTDYDGTSNAVNANRYLNMFLAYDTILSISEQGGVVKYE